LSTIERALIAPDGSLGPFEVLPNITLTTPRVDFSAAIVGQFLYVLGGQDTNVSAANLRSIERAAIQPDGSLGPFTPIAVPLSVPRSGHKSLVIGSFLYVLGGRNDASPRMEMDTVERASITSDGSIDSFSTVGVKFVTPRSNAVTHVVGRSLYLLGGANVPTVERANITPEGVLEGFTTIEGVTIAPLFAAQAFVSTNEICVIGGARLDLFTGDSTTAVSCAELH